MYVCTVQLYTHSVNPFSIFFRRRRGYQRRQARLQLRWHFSPYFYPLFMPFCADLCERPNAKLLFWIHLMDDSWILCSLTNLNFWHVYLKLVKYCACYMCTILLCWFTWWWGFWKFCSLLVLGLVLILLMGLIINVDFKWEWWFPFQCSVGLSMSSQ